MSPLRRPPVTTTSLNMVMRRETTMKRTWRGNLTRREVLHTVMAFVGAGVVGLTGRASARAVATSPAPDLELTPNCDDGDDDPTPAVTEGPYFKPNSPLRKTLIEPGLAGTVVTITGRVVTPACVPVEGALLDFWQADAHGTYDNSGFRLRGHQYTDADGMFTLTTVVPGLYPGRTRHLHVKAQAPKGRIVTTQLYFPGEPRNARDPFYMPSLELRIQDDAAGKSARFDVVVDTTERTRAGLYNA